MTRACAPTLERFELVETTHANWPRIPRELRPKRFYFSTEAARNAAVRIAYHFAGKGISGPVYRVRRVET